MVPIVTPAEMAAVDAAAPEPVEVLIERAGAAVARAARAMLGGAYGRRIVVVAGKGNNGNDGRVAARRLRERGVAVAVVDAAAAPARLPSADLVVDAAYGTGFRGVWPAPATDAPVLAVDIPSGLDGLTGEAAGGVLRAARTVTFAALKPGLLLGAGPAHAGTVEVADIGLDTSGARAHLVEAADVRAWFPPRPHDAHKWRAAVWVVAGSPGMTGAAHLAARAALRGGAGMVRLGSPGLAGDPGAPTEVVGRALPGAGWAATVLGELDRFHAVVVGPGLGRDEGAVAGVREVVARAGVPVVVDGDGLAALAGVATAAAGPLRERSGPCVLTPHDGEFAVLAGGRPGPDRFAAARDLAGATGAVVLLKGPTTIVAEPGGRAFAVATGDARLATAGTGDVLAGLIGAFCAAGLGAFEAAAAGAWVHGCAGSLGWRRGLVAGDLPDLVPRVFDEMLEA